MNNEPTATVSPAGPKQVLQRFYEAERRYMQAGGASGGASFE